VRFGPGSARVEKNFHALRYASTVARERGAPTPLFDLGSKLLDPITVRRGHSGGGPRLVLLIS